MNAPTATVTKNGKPTKRKTKTAGGKAKESKIDPVDATMYAACAASNSVASADYLAAYRLFTAVGAGRLPEEFEPMLRKLVQVTTDNHSPLVEAIARLSERMWPEQWQAMEDAENEI
jgi:hypothetical protein